MKHVWRASIPPPDLRLTFLKLSCTNSTTRYCCEPNRQSPDRIVLAAESRKILGVSRTWCHKKCVECFDWCCSLFLYTFFRMIVRDRTERNEHGNISRRSVCGVPWSTRILLKLCRDITEHIVKLLWFTVSFVPSQQFLNMRTCHKHLNRSVLVTEVKL